MVANLRVFKIVYKCIGPAGDPRSPKAFIYRDFAPDPTQGTAVQANCFYSPVWQHPLRIPMLVATRPRSILTLYFLKFPTLQIIYRTKG